MKAKTTFDPATARTYYLNQSGTRAISIDGNGNRETLPVILANGEAPKPRAVLYWEQCGNFAYPSIRVKGKAVAVYPDSDVAPTVWMPFALRHPSA
jgi:hypothetical protein